MEPPNITVVDREDGTMAFLLDKKIMLIARRHENQLDVVWRDSTMPKHPNWYPCEAAVADVIKRTIETA